LVCPGTMRMSQSLTFIGHLSLPPPPGARPLV